MIHQSANIHPDAQVAEDVIIDPFATIEKNTVIESGTWIGSGASIMAGARIGKNCKIHNYAVVSSLPQDLKYKGEETSTIIKNNVIIREFATINKGTSDKFKTEIGAHSVVMAYGHVAHDCIVGEHCIIGNVVQLGGHCIIEDYAIISGLSGAHQFSKIGRHAMVGTASMVLKDVPPYVIAGRNPLSYHGVNSVGLKRRGFTTDQITGIQNAYKQLYFGGLNFSDAVEKIIYEMPQTTERDNIINFIKNSERGIVKALI